LPFVSRLIADVLVPHELARLFTQRNDTRIGEPDEDETISHRHAFTRRTAHASLRTCLKSPDTRAGLRVERIDRRRSGRNIRPSWTTGIVRAPAGVSNFCDVHAPPSFATFCVLIWLSDEYRVFPQSPLTAGHCVPARRPSSPDCTATVVGTMNAHATATITSLMPLIEMLLAAQMIWQDCAFSARTKQRGGVMLNASTQDGFCA
jgi:hypothetical protein